MDASSPPGEFTCNSCFNWVSQEPRAARALADESATRLTAVPIRFANPRLKIYDKDNEPVMLLYDTDEDVMGAIHYPAGRFAREHMERFVDNFFSFLEALRRTNVRVSEIALR